MIELENLTAGYGDKLVLNSIQKVLPTEQIIGIVGLNGAGKTTFFNLLARVLKPFSGRILINGKPVKSADTGYLETSNFFYSRITGREYLSLFDQTNLQFNLEALLPYLAIPLDTLIETYSTGMKKKLALLAVIKQEKPVYLFDEPFNGLDIETNKVLELMLTTLKKKKKTIFLSSHILEPLLTVCDCILVLENGIFSRDYSRENFKNIDSDLFGTFKEQAQQVISGAL